MVDVAAQVTCEGSAEGRLSRTRWTVEEITAAVWNTTIRKELFTKKSAQAVKVPEIGRVTYDCSL